MPELPSSWMFWLVVESQAALPPAVCTALTFIQGLRVGLGNTTEQLKCLLSKPAVSQGTGIIPSNLTLSHERYYK